MLRFDNIAREWRCKWSADNDKACLFATLVGQSSCSTHELSVYAALKASLDEAQGALDSVLADVKSAPSSACCPTSWNLLDPVGLIQVDGVKSVQRVVCGGCLDFKASRLGCHDMPSCNMRHLFQKLSKVVVKLPADKFGDWENAGFAPEER